MLKKMARRGLIGLVAGVALEHVIALVTSIILNMGYYRPASSRCRSASAARSTPSSGKRA